MMLLWPFPLKISAVLQIALHEIFRCALSVHFVSNCDINLPDLRGKKVVLPLSSSSSQVSSIKTALALGARGE